MKYRLDMLVFEGGERYPILIDEEGMPHFHATLHVTSELRPHLAVNTIKNRLKALRWFFEWEWQNGRNLHAEFQQGQFLKDGDLESIREHMKLDVREHKKQQDGKALMTKKVFSIDDQPKMQMAAASVSSNHHYNQMTAVADYLHFVAKVANQHRNCIDTTCAIDNMQKRLKKGRPKRRKSSPLASALKVEDGLINEFLEVAHPEHAKNPFKNPAVQKRNYLMFRILKETGMRRGELLSLDITYMELSGSGRPAIKVMRKHDDPYDSRTVQPVTKTLERRLVIQPETARLIDSYILIERAKTPNAKKHPYLFVVHQKGSTQGQPVSTSTFDNDIVQAMKKVDERFKIIHPHLFRHDWNTRFSNKVDTINAQREQAKNQGKETKPPITPESAAQSRMHQMGHSNVRSGDPYNMRHIVEQAEELSLREQEELEQARRQPQGGQE